MGGQGNQPPIDCQHSNDASRAQDISNAEAPTTEKTELLRLWEVYGPDKGLCTNPACIKIREALARNPSLPASLIPNLLQAKLTDHLLHNPALPLLLVEEPPLGDAISDALLERGDPPSTMPQFHVEHLFQKARNYAGPFLREHFWAACADPRVPDSWLAANTPHGAAMVRRMLTGEEDGAAAGRAAWGRRFPEPNPLFEPDPKKSPENAADVWPRVFHGCYGRPWKAPTTWSADDTFRYLVRYVLAVDGPEAVSGECPWIDPEDFPILRAVSVLAGLDCLGSKMYRNWADTRKRYPDTSPPNIDAPIRFPSLRTVHAVAEGKRDGDEEEEEEEEYAKFRFSSFHRIMSIYATTKTDRATVLLIIASHLNREDEWKPDELIETLQALDRLRKACRRIWPDFPTRLQEIVEACTCRVIKNWEVFRSRVGTDGWSPIVELSPDGTELEISILHADGRQGRTWVHGFDSSATFMDAFLRLPASATAEDAEACLALGAYGWFPS